MECNQLGNRRTYGGSWIYPPRIRAEMVGREKRMTFPKLINWNLVSHPLNWVIILLMLVIAGAIGHTALSLAGIEPSTTGGSNKGKKNAYGSIPAGQVPAGDALAAINPASAGLVS